MNQKYIFFFNHLILFFILCFYIFYIYNTYQDFFLDETILRDLENQIIENQTKMDNIEKRLKAISEIGKKN